MKVILQETIDTLGQVGQIVNVADGYARNFLLPRKKATLASDRNVRALNHQKLLVDHRRASAVKAAQEIRRRIESVRISVERQAGDHDRLFGSVTAMDIESSLRSEGIEIDRRSILLEEPIKNIGRFTVPIKLHSDVTAQVQLFVVKKT